MKMLGACFRSLFHPKNHDLIRKIPRYVSEDISSQNYVEITFSLEMPFSEYETTLRSLLDWTRYREKQYNERIGLDLGFWMPMVWPILFRQLNESRDVLSKVDDLVFSDSAFSSKELLDLYDIFKKCEAEGRNFPWISANRTPLHTAYYLSIPNQEESKNTIDIDKGEDSVGSKSGDLSTKKPWEILEKGEFLEVLPKIDSKDFLKKVFLDDEARLDTLSVSNGEVRLNTLVE